MASAENPPVPDPTVLSTDAIDRAVGNLKELMEARVDGIERESDEKFRAVDTQFSLVERQRVEQKTDTKDAVDAALAAAKEAVKEQTTASDLAIEKSERASVKSIDQLGEKFETSFQAQRRDSDDLARRLTIVESKKVAVEEASSVRGDMQARLLASIGVCISVLALIAFVIVAVLSR